MRKARMLAGAGLGAIALVAGATTPASAHEQRTYLLDGRGYGGVTSDHRYVYACDTKADGWGVRTWYYWRTSGGSEYLDHVGDGNGSQSGCGREYGGTVVRFLVCAGPNGADYTCAGWTWVS